ncbi:MAG: MerR family transcriptional regulator [Rubrobacteraceae bacterium]
MMERRCGEVRMEVTVWKVGELADQTGLSVRTLHHYDEIGLLSPSRRSEAGYRLYGAEDIERLQRIKSLRQLGFGLKEIRRVLGNEELSPEEIVRRHMARLEEEIETRRKLHERLRMISARL